MVVLPYSSYHVRLTWAQSCPQLIFLRLAHVDVTKGVPHTGTFGIGVMDAKEVVDGVIHFQNVKAHDSILLRLTPATQVRM